MKIIYLILLISLCKVSFSQDSLITYLFVGSYNYGEQTDGLYVFKFNSKTGQLNKIDIKINVINPSFITLSPNGQYLYACTDTKLDFNGSVSAFKIDSRTGQLTYINKQDAGGRNPVHLTVHPSGKFLINSNYTDSGISIFNINKDGYLAPHSQLINFEGSSIIDGRQNNSHIHSAIVSPTSDKIYAPDLGADKIRVLQIDSTGFVVTIDSLEVNTKKGNGPRHFTFHPDLEFAYCLNELSGTISAYQYIQGHLNLINDYFSYSKKQVTYGSSDIHISSNGLFLYASNRWIGENTISIFKINQLDGTLKLIKHQPTFGDHPRSFVIDPSGNFILVANQVTGNIIVFKLNKKTGLMSKTKYSVNLRLPSTLKMKTYHIN